jgi:hypothetical protein
VRARRRRGFTSLSATHGCDWGGGQEGRGGHQIFRTSLAEPEPPYWEGRGHQGLHTCFRFLGTGDRSGPDPPPIRGVSRLRAGRRRDFTSLSGNPQGGTGEGGRGFQIEQISRDLESRGLSHASLSGSRGAGVPLQTKSAGLPGITRQRVDFPLKIFD